MRRAAFRQRRAEAVCGRASGPLEKSVPVRRHAASPHLSHRFFTKPEIDAIFLTQQFRA
jgi:hypothetical protein